MKEILSYATNTLAGIGTSGKIEAQAEVILVLTEPTYRLTSDGDMARERTIETVRFVASATALRTFANRLNKSADQIEADLKKALDPQFQFPTQDT